MLTVETFIGPSKIQGIGLFTVFNIKKGRKVWEFCQGLDISIPWCHLVKGGSSWSKRSKDYIKRHAYKDINGLWYLCGDNTRFMNHSFSPNLITRDGCDFAVRDIKSGEELTIDYSTFDLDWKRKLKGIHIPPNLKV